MTLYHYHRIRPALAALGVHLPAEPEQLGEGSFAQVWATECGRVVKVTEDRRERFAATLVWGSPQRHLVRVDHVFRSGPLLTVIVAERLEPISAAVRCRWWTPNNVVGLLQHGPVRFSAYEGEYPFQFGLERTRSPPHEDTLADLAAIADSLLGAGITFCNDVHQLNVMRRPGTGEIVLADLGMTDSPREPEPPELPGVLEAGPGEAPWSASISTILVKPRQEEAQEVPF